MGVSPSKQFGEEAVKVITKPVHATASGPREIATVAGGCFWGIELAFQRVPGVIQTQVGYTQGHKENPTYEEVCSGTTGHTEAVQITYDTNAIKYDDLLTILWDRIDPTTLNRQGNDMGTQYRSGIYYHTVEQRDIALRSREELQKKKYPHASIETEIKAATTFYPAEPHHQQYLSKGGQCSATGDLTPIRCYG
mmetsp:Transcript_14309/g.23797  ORF Transcript_14309/g.23797 Transcript_14309/m.23797 type:complete len:194 (+) Transcript_14309:39-620(+)